MSSRPQDYLRYGAYEVSGYLCDMCHQMLSAEDNERHDEVCPAVNHQARALARIAVALEQIAAALQPVKHDPAQPGGLEPGGEV